MVLASANNTTTTACTVTPVATGGALTGGSNLPVVRAAKNTAFDGG